METQSFNSFCMFIEPGDLRVSPPIRIMDLGLLELVVRFSDLSQQVDVGIEAAANEHETVWIELGGFMPGLRAPGLAKKTFPNTFSWVRCRFILRGAPASRPVSVEGRYMPRAGASERGTDLDCVLRVLEPGEGDGADAASATRGLDGSEVPPGRGAGPGGGAQFLRWRMMQPIAGAFTVRIDRPDDV